MGSYRIPILDRDNHEIWFQDMTFELRGKDLYYVVETTLKEYAWIRKLDKNSPAQSSGSENPTKSDMENLTAKFEELCGSYDSEKKRTFERDQAKAFHVISMSLGEEDKVSRGEFESNIKGFWNSLKAKYQKTSQSTSSQFMTKIQTFTFDKDKGIFAAWSLLKDYRRKLVAANPNLRQTYPDEALFLILTRSLPKSFKPLTRAFIAQPNLTIQEKMDMLIEHEMELREEDVAESAHFSKANAKGSKKRQQTYNSDSDENSGLECHLCHEDHLFRFCKHVKLAGKLLRHHLREQKKISRSSKKSIQQTNKRHKRTRGYKAVSDNPSEFSSDNSEESDSDEICNLSQEDINT